MSTFKLLKAEILHRKTNFALSLLALVAAATLFVTSPTLMRGYQKQSSLQLQEMQDDTTAELQSMHEAAEQRIKSLRDETDRQLADLKKVNKDQLNATKVELENDLLTLRDDTEQDLDALQTEMNEELAAMQAQTDAELARMAEDAQTKLAALDKQTKRIMRDLGFNLRIVHQNTDMSKLLANFESYPMPEEYIERLAGSPEITKIVHLVATLKKMIQWEDQPRLLVGFAPEATQSHIEKKPPMGFQIKPGMVFLGFVAGLNHEVGDKVEILGKEFEVANILPSRGDRDNDILIAMHLKDAQEVLEMPNLISEIVALGCKCKTVERIEEIREQLRLVLPEAQVTEMSLKAIARDDQRKLVTAHAKQAMDDYKANRAKIMEQEKATRDEIVAAKVAGNKALLDLQAREHAQILDREDRLRGEIIEREEKKYDEIAARETEHQNKMIAGLRESRASVMDSEEEHQATVLGFLGTLTNIITPLIILVCAIWVGASAWTNVRERRTEIGLLRSLGKDSVAIASLFLGKAILLGVVGGVIGCLLGLGLSQLLAAQVLDGATAAFAPAWPILVLTIIGTPLVAAMASYLPTLVAITQDPAVVLMES